MSVRTAELLMAVAMLIVSIAVMLKSAELNIGWVPERGPGSGAWPFWLSVGMALASVATIVRWFLRITPESRSTAPYIAGDTVFLVLITVLALLGLILMIEFIGTYLAIMLFLAFYLGVIGRHGWKTIFVFVLAAPTVVYLLFEVALTKYLPKGLEPFEEAFLIIDDYRYQIQYHEHALWISGAITAWVLLAILAGVYAERLGRNGVLAFLLSILASGVVGLGVLRYLGRRQTVDPADRDAGASVSGRS